MAQEMKMGSKCRNILAEADSIALSSRSGKVCSVAVAIAILAHAKSEISQLLDEMFNEMHNNSGSALDVYESLQSILPRRTRSPRRTLGSAGKIVDVIIERAQSFARKDNRIVVTDFDLLRAVIAYDGAASKIFRQYRITAGALEEKRRMNAA